MKCSACENNKCEGKYENRDKCVGKEEGIECTCICRITRNEAVLSSALSIGTGVAVAAAGIGLTVATGGMAAIIAGAAIAGSGTSLVFSPIQKHMAKEHVTLKESAKEAAIGATIGGITGPIGAIGAIASKGASGAVQFGARILAGSSAGAVTGVLSEGAKAMQGEEVTFKSVAHSAVVGAAVGTIGGASSQIATGVTKPISNEIGKAATRIAVQGSSAAVTDVGVQLVNTGTVNPQRLILNTAGKMALSTTAEVSTSVTKQIDIKIADSHNKKPILVKSGKVHIENKDVKLKKDQGTDQQGKNQALEKSNSDLQEKIKPQYLRQTRQQQEVQLDQNQVTKAGVSESFDQKLMGVVNSTGLAFNGMISGLSSQLKTTRDNFAGLKTLLNQNNVKDEEQKEEEIQMQQTSSKEVNDSLIGNANETTVLSEADKLVHSLSSNSISTEITDLSDELEPLLMKIDYDLLLEAQSSDELAQLDQSNLSQSTDVSHDENSDRFPVKPSSSLKHETQELVLKTIQEPSTSYNYPIISQSNQIDRDLEQLSTLVSQVFANMESEATLSKEVSSVQCTNSLSTNNIDSHTREEYFEDKEAIDESCSVLETNSSLEQNMIIDQKTRESDEIDSFIKYDDLIAEPTQNLSNLFEGHRLSQDQDKEDPDHEEGMIDSKTQNIVNPLKQRAEANLRSNTDSKCEMSTTEINSLRKNAELESEEPNTATLIFDFFLILIVLAVMMNLIVLTLIMNLQI